MKTASLLAMCAIAVFAPGCSKKSESSQATSATAEPSGESAAQPARPSVETKNSEGNDSSSIVGQELRYRGGGVEMVGYLAYDESMEGERPGVLVVHEWWGHNEYVRRRARMLAELGYTAFALDMYGGGKNTQHPKDAMAFSQAALSDLDVAVARFRAAREVLEAHPTVAREKIAATGYCFGGAVVLHMARIGADLDAVVSFHGTLEGQTKAEKGAVEAEILVLHGGADSLVPEESVEAFKEEMESAGADLRFVSYPGAKHAFTNPAATEMGNEHDLPLAYDKEADEKSWNEMKKLFAKLWKEE